MARGVNKAILIGNLGQDPDVRYTPSGAAVCNIPLATTESWKDKETHERQESTEWHRLVFFGRLAEITGEYLRKGSQIYAEGRLQTRKWQDKSGNDRYTTEIIVSEMHILGSRANNAARHGNEQPGQKGHQEEKQPPKQPVAAPDADNFDDDIPF